MLVARSAPTDTDLDCDGYVLLRGAVPVDWIERLRDAFDAGTEAAARWPTPRGPDWRHAFVDLDPWVQRACRLEALLRPTARVLGRPFFLAHVEGREPLAGGGAQLLHRDGPRPDHTDTVSALIFLDPFGPENGATRVAAGTHRHAVAGEDEPPFRVLSGEPGDVLLFDANLLHGGTLNRSGARRRSLLLTYAVEALRGDYDGTRAPRGARADLSESFAPAPDMAPSSR